MKRIRYLFLLFCAASAAADTVRWNTVRWDTAPLKVVTTTQDLADLARQVGGNRVQVESLSKGYQDPHFVEAKPSLIVKLVKADLFIQIGLELEIGWAPLLVQSSRNKKILPGSPGYLDASQAISPLEIPANPSRAMGDVHPLGNPHYWLDPLNGIAMAKLIAERLGELDPKGKKDYQAGFNEFEARMQAKLKEWTAGMAPFKGMKVVAYHNSWPYFARRFDIAIVNFVEPKPGIPPSPAHVSSLMNQIRAEGVKLLIIDPYFDDKLPRKIASETGVPLVVLPPSVGAVKEIETYVDLFDYDLKQLKENLE